MNALYIHVHVYIHDCAYKLYKRCDSERVASCFGSVYMGNVWRDGSRCGRKGGRMDGRYIQLGS